MKLQSKLITVLLFLIMSGLLYSVDDGVKLENLGEWRTFGYSHAAVQGKYAYLTRTLGGVDIFDIGKKNNPVFKGYCNLPTRSSVITVSGKYAYVAVNNTHIEILDIADPANTKRVGVYSNKFIQINGLWLNGNYLYIRGHTWKGDDYSWTDWGIIDIIDISDPSNPKSKAVFENKTTDFGKFIISGNYMYVPGVVKREMLEDQYILLLYNISNPSSPQFIKQFDIVSDLKTFYPSFTAVSGNKILWSRSGEMKLLDISDPLQPSVLETNFKKEYHSMLLSGQYVYLFNNEAKLEVVDVSDPVNPVNAGSLTVNDSEYFVMELESNGALFCVTDDYESDAKGFDIFDISNPSAPVKSGSVYQPGRGCILHHAVLGKYAFLADGLRGLHILDLSNPAAPVKLGLYVSNGTNSCRVAAYKNYAYLINSGGLEIIDVSNKSAPVLTGSLSLGELSDPEIAITGNYVIVKNGEKILVIDVTTKTAPSLVSTYDNGSVIQDMKTAGNYVYIAAQYTTNVIDISNKSLPSKVASTPGSGKISIYGNYLYIIVNGDDLKIRVVDISNPGQPVVSGYYKSMDTIKTMTVFGNFAYLTYRYNDCWSDGVALGAVDVSNPASPRQICYNYSPTGSCMSSDGSNLYISTTSLYGDATEGDGAPGLFSILKIVPTPASWIELVSPNGGETLSAGATVDIRWTNHNYPEEVACSLLSGGCYYDSISAEFIEPGLLRWKVPETIPEGNIYRIKIQGKNHIFDVSDDNFWIKPNWSSCSMSLSRKKLNFGAVSGKTPPKQEVVVNLLCIQSFNWSAQCDQGWLSVAPGSRYGSDAILVGVDPSGLTEGAYSGKIIVTSAQAGISPQEISVTLNVKNTGTSPFGEFSTPVAGAAVNGSVPVTGWALDDVGVSTVKIYRDPVSGEENKKIFIGDALFVEGARPDVEAAYPDFPGNDRAGWGYMLLTHFLPGGGNGSYTLYAVATDDEGNEITLGSRVFTCNNAQAVEPFGAIDTPTPGGVVSGNDFENFGWALTPLPNMIPDDGNTITVWIDGKPAGKPIYDDYREDIASLFPGYLNVNGAGGHFNFNPKAYTNGIHTIAWSVKDNAGNEQGIGSRFFSIRNKNQYPVAANQNESENRNAGISNLNTRTNSIEIEETGRLELYLFDESTHKNGAHSITNISKLPIGSTLDKTQGVFYWQPAPGFIGNYKIEFIEKTPNGKNIKRIVNVKITPKFN